MANYERDKDDVRVFDGGEDDESEGSHLPVVIIIAILVLAAFGGVVWLAYNQGVARGRGEIPVQMAANEPGKPGGQIKVYEQPAGGEEEENVQTALANPQTGEPSGKPAAARVAQPSPAAALTAVKPQPQPQAAVATKPPAQLGLAHPAEQAVAPPAMAPQTAAKPVAAPKPVAVVTAKPVEPKPVAVVAAKPVEPKPVAVVTAKPVETRPMAVGGYLLQVGAYKSQDEAMAAWKVYAAKHAALLKGFSPDVQRADLGGKGVWYRLRLSSFADKSAATALCERLQAESGACFLAR